MGFVYLTIDHSIDVFFPGTYSMQITTTVPKKVEHILHNLNGSEIKNFLNNSRRIVIGSEALESRPYMVRIQFIYIHKKMILLK